MFDRNKNVRYGSGCTLNASRKPVLLPERRSQHLRSTSSRGRFSKSEHVAGCGREHRQAIALSAPTFAGRTNHAGTTPGEHHARRCTGSTARWIAAEVERYALDYKQLVATVGQVEVLPGAGNVVPGLVRATLDVRHPNDASRHAAAAVLQNDQAEAASELRGVRAKAEIRMQQNAAIPMDRTLTAQLAGGRGTRRLSGERDVFRRRPRCRQSSPRTSWRRCCSLRSPGGLSHQSGRDRSRAGCRSGHRHRAGVCGEPATSAVESKAMQDLGIYHQNADIRPSASDAGYIHPHHHAWARCWRRDRARRAASGRGIALVTVG